MGGLFFFDEVVTCNNNSGKQSKCTVEVVDNHSVPEVRIGPVGAAYSGAIAEFDDWDQFTRFVEAVEGLHARLSGIYEK